MSKRVHYRKQSKNYLYQAADSEKAARKEEHKQAKRREDGMLECPVRYCAGYGFDKGPLDLN